MSTKEIVNEIMECKFTFEGLSHEGNGRIMVKDDRVEIVKVGTKEEYKEYLDDHLDHVERLKERVLRSSNFMRAFINNEIKTTERIIAKEIERLTKMVVVSEEAESLAKF